MISDTIVDLCDAVSELAAERNEYRRKAESQAARHSDEVEALRAERDEARVELLEATSSADRMSSELEEAAAKLALQQQIATGAATQRDEQTARLAEAQAEIARLRAERACKQCGKRLDAWCEQCDVPDEDEPTDCAPPLTEANAEKLWMAMREFPIAHEWDDVSPFTHDAFTRTIVTHVNPKTSKPAVDVEELESLAVKAYWNHPDDGVDPSVCAAVRAVLAHLSLTPATPQTGEVGT